jgi:phytanoyl-CoA hydroxylase
MASPVVTPEQAKEWNARGFLKWDALLSPAEVAELSAIVDDVLAGKYADAAKHRYDLGAGAAKQSATVENITQIMWVSDIVPALRDHPVRRRALEIAAGLWGAPVEEFDYDFDMSINKLPHTNTPTPAHQDQAYWPPLDDTRSVSFWVALDASTVDNGCMWYGAGTHTGPLRPHRRAGADANAALQCDATEDEMEPMPLAPGSAGLHMGRTLHYSRGNTTSGPRRAFIMNFRPAKMVAYERAQGFDHGRAGHKSHEVRTKA